LFSRPLKDREAAVGEAGRSEAERKNGSHGRRNHAGQVSGTIHQRSSFLLSEAKNAIITTPNLETIVSQASSIYIFSYVQFFPRPPTRSIIR
jgi:hypothetical protein